MVDRLRPIKTAKKPVRFDLGPKALSTPSETKPKQPKRGSLSVHTESGSSRSNVIPRARRSPPIPGRRKHHTSSRRTDLPIPPPPEGEPTPPTEVVRSLKGNLYTVEEKKYFSKYISWALQVDPLLTKSELVEKLAEKVCESVTKPETGLNLHFS